MTIRKLLLASAGALMLQSCVTTPPPLTAADLLSTPYALPAGKAFDVDAFFGALPEWLTVRYDNAAFDSAIGAMVVRDVVFELDSAPGYLLRAEQMRIWDADVSAMERVFDGVADTSQMSQLFDRIAFDGIQSEGLQWGSGAQSVGMSIDKLVMDGVAARSFSLVKKEGAPDGVGALRKLAALASSYTYDGAAYSNFSFQANDNQGNAATIGLEQAFARNYEAGKVEYYSATGLHSNSTGTGNSVLTEVSQAFDGSSAEKPSDKILQPNVRERMREALNNPVALLAAANGGMASGRDIQFMEMRDMDLSGALSWLAKWELPPLSETNLLDFGSATIIGDKQSINGNVFYEGGRVDISAMDFYWLIPSNITYSETDSRFDLSSLVNVMGLEAVGGNAQLAQAKEVIAALGLEQFSFDAGGNWHWDGESGDAQLQSGVDIHDFADLNYGTSLGGPNLVQWDALVRSDQMNAAAKEMSLGAFNFSLTDHQMLDRVFAYVAQQSGGTAEDLRVAMPALLRASSGEVAQMNPRIPAYIDAIANFIAGGGSLSIEANPEAPISFQELEVLNQSPQTVPDVLNLTVTHSE